MAKGRRTSGFTIIEIMIVVTIIGFLAVIALPAVARARLRSQNVRFMNDLRLLSGEAFDYYAFQYGDLPPDAAPGVVPPDIGSYLPRRFDWTKPTAIGGVWDWDRAPDRSQKVDGMFYGGITIRDPGRTTTQMEAIDAAMDDGSLSTGLFRFRAPGVYTYIVEY